MGQKYVIASINLLVNHPYAFHNLQIVQANDEDTAIKVYIKKNQTDSNIIYCFGSLNIFNGRSDKSIKEIFESYGTNIYDSEKTITRIP